MVQHCLNFHLAELAHVMNTGQVIQSKLQYQKHVDKSRDMISRRYKIESA